MPTSTGERPAMGPIRRTPRPQRPSRAHRDDPTAQPGPCQLNEWPANLPTTENHAASDPAEKSGSDESGEPDEPVGDEPSEPQHPGASTGSLSGSARIGSGTHRCRFAGAMLLYPYLDRVGAEAIFGALSGDTVEGAKHLRRGEAGPVVGLVSSPELATLRARLAALADGSDPLGLQRAFAAQMIAADPAGDPVYFVDDHFKAYSGARPVGKGWNTKRRHAQPGIDDTHLVDARGRA